ncbi:unnamed protein product [Candidula unifasciata]|uniref:N-acetyltransferase domain-containing protein n=1 Tax=Candidula unifasciata TaxID=100452 RepID=A0A8S3YIB3_9EUPU|nr:unnamed protein product [Candidula unifasciata]
MANSEVIIREARLEDFDDFVEIGDVYEGKDYLIDHYHSYFNNPVIYPLVAEVGGKAVGFYMNQFIDGGRTLIKRAARVHPDYRGKGIFHLLSEALDRHREQFWPQVEYEVFGTTNRADRAAKEFQEKGFVELVRKRVLNLYVRIDELKGLDANTGDLSRVTNMTYDDVKLLFADNLVVNKLFPKGIIFNWFIGYMFLESNIGYLVGDNEFVLASTSSETPLPPGDSGDQKSGNFTPETIKHIDVISCAHKHTGVLGLSYEIDIYTADGYDESMIKAHLIKHFRDFRESTKKDGITMITFNSNVKEEVVVGYLNELGIVDFIHRMETYNSFYKRKL